MQAGSELSQGLGDAHRIVRSVARIASRGFAHEKDELPKPEHHDERGA